MTRDADRAHCDHRWKFIRDSMGDPASPYGAEDCSHWECRNCLTTSTRRPDDWDDPRELAADDARDRERDEWRS